MNEILIKSKIAFALADQSHEAELRQLLRSNPMPGRITLSLEREPNFFLASTIEGDEHVTVVAHDTTNGALVGLCSRSVRSAYLNGQVARLGYLGQLRVAQDYRGRRGPLTGGFAFCRRLHEAGNTPLYITTIIEDNQVARRMLEANLPALPTYRKWETICTLVLPPWRKHRIPSSPHWEIRQGCLADLADIAAFLQKHYAAYQFAPHWTAQDLADPERSRGLAVEDFTLVCRAGKIVGCVALWNQQSFKQVVVHSYTDSFERYRGLINRISPLTGLPRLPEPGKPFAPAFLSHLAVEDHDPAFCLALLATASNRARDRNYDYLTLGIAQRHPLLRVIKQAYRHLEYRSILYVVHWEDGAAAAAKLDDRQLFHVEIATL